MMPSPTVSMTMLRQKSILSFLLATICVAALQAQVARLYSTQHGLKTNSCNSVNIDSKGLVWVSGYNTLGTFDGTKFQYLPNTDKDGRQLFQDVYCVKEETDSKYWVCTSQGLYMLDARENKYQLVQPANGISNKYGHATNDIIDYPLKDYKLITTDGFKVHVLNTATMQEDTKIANTINEIIQDGFVRQPLIDQYQRLWVTTPSTPVVCIDMKNMARHKFQITPAAKALLDVSNVTCLLEISRGLLIGTNHGLLFYNHQTNTVEELNMPGNNLPVSSMIKTHEERILIGTNGRGIWEHHETNGMHTLTPLYRQASGADLSYGKVMNMAEDHNGNVIAVFLQKGLVVIPPLNDCFHYHPISPTGNSLNATCVTSMAIDSNNNYWVATDGCGIFTTQGMKLATATPASAGLNSLLVQSVVIDKYGTIWAGSYGGGVQYMSDGRWTDAGLTSLNKENVMQMQYQPKYDQLLVATNGHGIYRINVKSKQISKIDLPFYYNQWVSSVLLDNNSTIWIGTSNGLIYYTYRTGKHEWITLNNNPLNNVSDIKQDGNNILIACDEGLVIYNINTNKQRLITDTDGLHTKAVRAIMVTPDRIWLATRTDIASIDKKDYKVRNFSSFNGYKIGEFHRGSTLQPSSNYILFGGDNGIICFTPQLILNRKRQLEHLYFTNIETPLHTEQLDASILYAKNIKLAYNNSSFVIDFAIPEIGDPDRIHYDYILKNHETLWHTDVSTHSASYSSLPPGNYTLCVRAYMEDNPDEYIENEISISIASPWYTSTWAIIVYLVIILMMAYVALQLLNIRRNQKRLLREASERNMIKEAKLKLFTSITHELRSPLTMIQSPLKQLMHEDSNSEHQSLYGIMLRNCNRLLDIVKQITDIRKIDSGQLNLKLEETDYVEYSEQIYEQFKGYASVKHINFVIDNKEEELPMMIDTTHFEKIITNILSNAFKYTPEGGTITATSSISGHKVQIAITNTGSHIDENNIEHLWQRFYQCNSSDDKSGSGIGLNLVYELVKMHQGDIAVTNLKPDGVQFMLTFPLYNTPEPAAAAKNNTKTTILIVDDDVELASYLKSQLENYYNIITNYSGSAAWKTVLSHRPDLVITDYNMPNGNGMELCQNIKNNPDTEDIPVIMLTGEGNETLQLHSLNSSADHYLEKPVNMMLLKSCIIQVLKVRASMRSKAKRIEFTTTVSSQKQEEPLINANDKLLSRIDEVIAEHIDDSEFSVKQLSEEVGLSRAHLVRKMKANYNMTPNSFIRSYRLKRAAYLLVNNNVNVSEIAYKVGFSTHSYFTTSFHDYFMMSPKEFIAFYSQPENKEALDKLLE